MNEIIKNISNQLSGLCFHHLTPAELNIAKILIDNGDLRLKIQNNFKSIESSCSDLISLDDYEQIYKNK